MHTHPIVDDDVPYLINIETKQIDIDAITFIQNDHNSERLTFSIPHFVDGHDMTLCNIKQIHYINTDAVTKATNTGIYQIEDAIITDDDIIFSWLVTNNATKYVGKLDFAVRFACENEDGVIDYALNTCICSNISVVASINNSEVVFEEVPDIVAQKIYADGKQSEYDRFWDAFQDNGNRTHYAFGFSGSGWNAETLKIKYPIDMGTKSPNHMFRFCNFSASTPIDMTEMSKKIDFSQIKTFTEYVFGNFYATNLTVDLSSATTVSHLCNSNSSGTKCPISMTIKISEKCTNYSNAFAYCVAMQELIFTEDSCIAASISVDRGQSLTPESLKSIIHALKDYSGTENALKYTVVFHPTALANLEAESTAPTGTTWAEYVNSKGWNI